MAEYALTALVPSAYVTGTWTTTTVGNIDEGISGADGAFIESTTNSATSIFYTFSDVPSDFAAMVALSYDIRVNIQHLVDDTETLSVRIFKSDRTTPLTDAMLCFSWNNNTHSSFTNKGVTSFTGVSTTATKAEWNAAVVALITTHSANMGADASHWNVDALELTGTYADVVAGDATVTLGSPADHAADTDATPTFTFTGTDPYSESLEYQVQVATTETFSSGTWAEEQPGGAADLNWRFSASDYDGSVLISACGVGRVYVRTDGTWAEAQPAGASDFNWYGCAVSGDGSVLMAAANAGRLWVRTGGTWAEARPAGDANKAWYSCAADADGSVLVAVVSGGRLYVRTDGTWAEEQPAGNTDQPWNSCACSSDGSVIIAGCYNGRLYVKSGGTWAEATPGGATNLAWYTVACSYDGTVLMAGIYSGRLWVRTSGVWAEAQPAGAVDKNWEGTAASSDGSVLMAGVLGGRLYVRTAGVWAEEQPGGAANYNWRGMGCSATGYVLVAGPTGGRLYVRTTDIPTLDRNSVDNAADFYHDGSDTHPFTSGHAITYTVASADTLPVDVYYWRVRAKDTTWGTWTSPWSYEVQTSGGPTTKVFTRGMKFRGPI